MFKKPKKIKPLPFEKIYMLPAWRSIVIGVIFIAMGIGINFIGIDFNNTFWNNLQWVLVSFRSLSDFFMSLLMLAFKALFLIAGYIYIKYSDGVIRAKVDQKGLYYQTIPNGSRVNKLAIDLNKLTFIPFSQIKNISYKTSFRGDQIQLETDKETVNLVALAALKESDKKDLVNTVLENLKRNQIQQ